MLMQPKDVKTGANAFEVMVKGADGKPVSDRDVSCCSSCRRCPP